MRKIIMLLALAVLTAASALAQVTRMTGQVLSADDGEPIIGATVSVPGTHIATATDAEGRFTLTGLTANNKHIKVTFVGYEQQTVAVAANVKVALKLKSELMDEVLVVAFGKQKRESFTGSAAVMKSDDIEKLQVNNPISALNGSVSGVQILQGNDPSDTPTVRIRGISSINAGNDPLIVLDGLPYNGYWTDLNTNDIASVTVLKDAASNALYGARGANGVILITTKSAQRGATRVNLDARIGANTDGYTDYDRIDSPGQYYEAHYAAMRNYLITSKGLSPYEAHVKANENLSDISSNGGLEYMVYTVPDGQRVIGENGKLNPNAVLGNRVYGNGQF